LVMENKNKEIVTPNCIERMCKALMERNLCDYLCALLEESVRKILRG
jgi:hypothetical protein